MKVRSGHCDLQFTACQNRFFNLGRGYLPRWERLIHWAARLFLSFLRWGVPRPGSLLGGIHPLEHKFLSRQLQLAPQGFLLDVPPGLQEAEALVDGTGEDQVLLGRPMGLFDVSSQPDGADELLEADSADIHEGVLPDMQLEGLVLGGRVAAELTGEGPLVTVDKHVAVPVQLVLELALADVAIVQQLSLALPGHQAQLVQGLLDLLVLRVVGVADVLDEVLDVCVLLLAEAAVLLDLLVDALDVHPEVALAQAGEGAVIAAELLTRVLPQVHVEVGLDGAGVAALGALVGLLVGVDPQVSLQRVLEFEDLVAVLTSEDLQLGGTKPRNRGQHHYIWRRHLQRTPGASRFCLGIKQKRTKKSMKQD